MKALTVKFPSLDNMIWVNHPSGPVAVIYSKIINIATEHNPNMYCIPALSSLLIQSPQVKYSTAINHAVTLLISVSLAAISSG